MDVLNPETLETFKDLLEPEELQDFLRRAQQELERSVQKMQQHFAAQEWPSLQAAAHRLKGSLGSLGCDALFQALDRLEEQLRAQPSVAPTAAQMQAITDISTQTALRLHEEMAAAGPR